MSIPKEYLVVVILIILGFIIYSYFNKQKLLHELKRKISEQWGKEPKANYNPSELASIASYINNIKNEDTDIHYIDDITWNDLDMDRVFMRLNNTRSTIGEEYLYYLLHNPVFDEKILSERDKLVEYFGKNPSERLELQVLLARLGKSKYLNISDYFFSNQKNILIKSIYYKILAAICVFSPFTLAIDVRLGFSVIILSIAINILVYYRAKKTIDAYLESLSYIIRMVVSAKKISKIDFQGTKEYNDELKSSVSKVKSVINKSFWFLSVTDNIFVEYLRTVLLGELIAFEGMFEAMHKYNQEFKRIYEIIGLLDSIVSIASYRDNLEYFTTPFLSNASKENKTKIISKDAYHPLIDSPVPNSIEMSRPMLITGSNASGKSTFLKTIAINAIFAQTIFTCLAKEYSSSYFMIFSSMALKDNLKGNESYYIAEIKSLKRIFDSINERIPCLCLVDEVLRGTNTVERIAASSEVLFHLSKSNSLCIAATHDIELTSILSNKFDNYHFQEKFTDDDIVFDYKIYLGKSTTRNAIKLLQFMDYEDEIVKSAEDRALHFVNEGAWKEVVV